MPSKGRLKLDHAWAEFDALDGIAHLAKAEDLVLRLPREALRLPMLPGSDGSRG